jgi:hypothetical protein
MVNLNVNWAGVEDRTGYLFSFAKSLSAVVKNSPYAEIAEDIIATSGFAFRMWVDAKHLCPSATSIWDFECQKPWTENGGLLCDYVGRYWGQDHIEEENRNKAIEMIRTSIDGGIPAVSWDIGLPEWGLITGYNDENKQFTTLSIKGDQGKMAYDLLGKREIPMLSVLTIVGRSQKQQQDILNDTLKLAVSHLRGEEWCENTKGLKAYPAFIAFFEEKFNPDLSWNMEYYLGTYGGLKLYACKYFEKMGLSQLTELYRSIYDNWKRAFEIKTSEDISDSGVRRKVVALLKEAYGYESEAVELMEGVIFP